MAYLARSTNVDALRTNNYENHLREFCTPGKNHPIEWNNHAIQLLNLIYDIAIYDLNVGVDGLDMTRENYTDFLNIMQHMADVYTKALSPSGYQGEGPLKCGAVSLHCACGEEKESSSATGTITPSTFRVILITAAMRAIGVAYVRIRRQRSSEDWWKDSVKELWYFQCNTQSSQNNSTQAEDVDNTSAFGDYVDDWDDDVQSVDDDESEYSPENDACANNDSDSDADIIEVDIGASHASEHKAEHEQSQSTAENDGEHDDAVREETDAEENNNSDVGDANLIVSDDDTTNEDDDGYEDASPVKKRIKLVGGGARVNLESQSTDITSRTSHFLKLAEDMASEFESMEKEKQALTSKLQQASNELDGERTKNKNLRHENTILKEELLQKTRFLEQLNYNIEQLNSFSASRPMSAHSLVSSASSVSVTPPAPGDVLNLPFVGDISADDINAALEIGQDFQSDFIAMTS